MFHLEGGIRMDCIAREDKLIISKHFWLTHIIWRHILSHAKNILCSVIQ